MTEIDIKKISFGRTAAEKEEQMLKEYFISTRAYLNAKKENMRKIFYVGHRGAGKSALFNQLAAEYRQNKNAIIIDIKPGEFSYEIFHKMKHDYPNIKTAYSLAWEYMLLMKIFIEVSDFFNSNLHIKKNRENVSIVQDYLIRNNYQRETKNLKIFFDYLKNLVDARVNVDFKIFEIEANLNPKGSQNKLLNLLYFEDLARPKNALKMILLQHPVYLFLDELDKGWDNSTEAINYINGLFDSVYTLSTFNGLNLYVSLRQDMYNNLIASLTNAEKIREDIEKLHWDKKGLKSLIAKRILSCLPEHERENKNIYTEDAINLVFEEGVLDHIIDFTLHRPREVIEFCNRTQEEYTSTYHQHYNSNKKIDMPIINGIKPDFSTYRIQDICKEYQFEYPHIQEIMYSFEHGKEFYDKKEFIGKVEDGILILIEKHGEVEWLKEEDFNANAVMELLFTIGFIQVFIPSENSYFAAYDTNILDFETVSKIKINNVFVPVLKCHANAIKDMAGV